MSNSGYLNNFLIRFANVNGTGSASANGLFSKAIFRMGIPVSAKNIFPSNIQGLPTWFDVRVSEKGYLARKENVDFIVAVNPQSFNQDMDILRPGGYFMYDNTKDYNTDQWRTDIHIIGVPMMGMCMTHFNNPRHQQLFKNVVYVGALAALLQIDLQVFHTLLEEKFGSKPKLIPPNIEALQLGFDYAISNYSCPLELHLKPLHLIADKIVVDGNTATALGALYAGATVATWYPITPSTSVVQNFEKFANKYRKDPETGKNNYAIVQAEDELAAIGMALGGGWNGARAFTATSGAGISLMNEFIGMAYFAEIPVVVVNVQRGGPSTGMPTRTQQGDILSTAYASHGDTKHILLFPSSPKECFDFMVKAFDYAELYQTAVFVMSDLDLGMNDHLTEPFEWDDSTKYDRGKVITAKQLDEWKEWGRYVDLDDDGIPYRSLPGTHPTKGAFVTRGTSKNTMAKYSESSKDYVINVDRLGKKWNTISAQIMQPDITLHSNNHEIGIIYYGTSDQAVIEAADWLKSDGILPNLMKINAFPFHPTVNDFIQAHQHVFVVDQNRLGQMKMLLINELDINTSKLTSILNYDGLPLAAECIHHPITQFFKPATS